SSTRSSACGSRKCSAVPPRTPRASTKGGVHRAARAVSAFFTKAYKDGLTGLAAMVAYNLLASIFPLALIALFIFSRVLRSPELAASVLADAQTVFPKAAESTLTDLILRVQQA